MGWQRLVGFGSGLNNVVRAAAADAADHLFVVGDFTLAGGNVSCYIAEAYLHGLPIPPGGVMQRIRLAPGNVSADVFE